MRRPLLPPTLALGLAALGLTIAPRPALAERSSCPPQPARVVGACSLPPQAGGWSSDPSPVTLGTVGAAGGAGLTDGLGAADAFAPSELGPGVEDPRKRRAPRTHRFRLGFQMDYVRLSAAQDESGYVQRFHYLPLQLDFAYQVQLLKHFMLRPSLALGANPANTLESMPAVVHPQIFGGYQGKAVGVALGYGYMHPFPAVKDLISNTRGGLGQPIITANHAVRVELSYTTRVDHGALSFAVRIGGLKSHIQHYELDQRSWRFFSGINFGWYFGDGHKSREREQERAERRRERKRN